MNNRKNHSIAKSLQEDTFVNDTSLHSFQDDLRTAERERLQENQKRKELLDSLKNKFKSPKIEFDRSEIRSVLINAIQVGKPDDIDSAINAFKREQKLLINKNNLSEYNQQCSEHLYERAHHLKTKRQLYEKIANHLSQIQQFDFDDNPQPVTIQSKPSNQSFKAIEDKLTNLFNNLHADINYLVNELTEFYKQLENRIQSDLEEESRLQSLFFLCTAGLPLENKKKFLHIYNTKCKYAFIDIRIKQFKKLIETLAKKSKFIAEKVHLHTRKLARQLANEGKTQNAIHELRYALTLYKDSNETLRQLEFYYTQHEDKENLSRVLLELNRLNPQNLMISKRAGLLCEKLKKWQQAETIYANASEHHPHDLELYKRRVAVLYQLKDYSKIIAVLQPYINQFEHDFELNKWFGLSLSEQKQFDESISYLQQSYKINNNDKDVFYAIINTFRKTRQHQEALTLLQQALQENPQSLSILLLMGSVHKENGDYQKALEYFESILEHHSPTNSILHSIGQLQIELGQHEHALETFKKALELNASHEESIVAYAQQLQKLNRVKEAEDYLSQQLPLFPESINLKQELVSIYMNNGNWKEATKTMKEIKKLQ